MYCPPINRDRFEREFNSRNKLNCEQLSTTYDFSIRVSKNNYNGSNKFLWAISNPIRVYELVRDYYMIGDFNLIAQIVYIFVLFHLFFKSLIHTVATGDDKEKIKYFDSIYYPHIAGFLSKPYMFNYLFLGYSSYILLARIFRLCSVIGISLRNANEYKDLRVGQLNTAYLASMYLSPKEWFELWKFATKHENGDHQNEKIRSSHLESDTLVQQTLSRLNNLDAVFFVNPIDFDKCFAESVLSKSHGVSKEYRNWHFAYPRHRISHTALREVIFVTIYGWISMPTGFITALAIFIYLELRSEFPPDYSPKIGELIKFVPHHWSKLLSWIRMTESGVIILSQILIMYDFASIILDMLAIKVRTQKMVEIFGNYLEFSRRSRVKLSLEFSQLEAQYKGNYSPSFCFYRGIDSLTFRGELFHTYEEYNRKVRHDIVVIRLLYYELVNTKKHLSGFFNMIVIGGSISVAFLIPILISEPISAETCILFGALLCSVMPIIAMLVYCARMERMVSFLMLL